MEAGLRDLVQMVLCWSALDVRGPRCALHKGDDWSETILAWLVCAKEARSKAWTIDGYVVHALARKAGLSNGEPIVGCG